MERRRFESLPSRTATLFLLIGVAVTIFAGCGRKVEQPLATATEVEAELVPLEDALARLSDFNEDEGATKASTPRTIESIETFSFSTSSARTNTKSGTDIPDAYIVNYHRGEGFAVLGANTAVSPIIAVTRSGSLHGKDLEKEITPLRDEELWDEGKEEFYPVGGSDFMHLLIRCALQRRGSTAETKSGGSGERYHTAPPLTGVRWGQDPPFNTYCTSGGKVRLTGCSTTALCQILATLGEPRLLHVDGKALHWDEMTCAPEVKLLSSSGRDDVAKLLGAVFNHTGKVFLNGGTAISAAAVRSTMEKELGFRNVVNNAGFSYSEDLLRLTGEMLREGKPVFVSAILRISDISSGAHSWVVDGARYSRSGDYMLHFNFGWEGLCDGYFSPTCINPSKGYSYDSPTLRYDTPSRDKKYTWHFRLLSYDLPSSHGPVHLNTAK